MQVDDLRRKLLEAAAAQAECALTEDSDDAPAHARAARELTDALVACNELVDAESWDAREKDLRDEAVSFLMTTVRGAVEEHGRAANWTELSRVLHRLLGGGE